MFAKKNRQMRLELQNRIRRKNWEKTELRLGSKTENKIKTELSWALKTRNERH